MRISDWSSDVCSSDLDRHVARADAHRVARMLGIEFPRQLGRHVGIEAYRDRVAQHLRLGRRSDRIVALRRAVEAGDLAEQIIEGHRREAEPDHRSGSQPGDDPGAAVLPACRLARHFGPIIRAMVMKKKRKASPPRIQHISLARLRWRRRYSASSKDRKSTRLNSSH